MTVHGDELESARSVRLPTANHLFCDHPIRATEEDGERPVEIFAINVCIIVLVE